MYVQPTEVKTTPTPTQESQEISREQAPGHPTGKWSPPGESHKELAWRHSVDRERLQQDGRRAGRTAGADAQAKQAKTAAEERAQLHLQSLGTESVGQSDSFGDGGKLDRDSQRL